MRSVKISRILVAFAVVVTLGLVTSIGIQFFALEKLKVNGPIYNDVINGKDLIADILPPPLYVIESYMLAGEAVNEPDLMSQNIAKITALKQSYEERRKYWQVSSLPKHLKAKLRDDVLLTGDAFWKDFEGSYLAAVKAGDMPALQTALKLLGKDFRLHDERVRELVDLSTAYTMEKEGEARTLSFWLERSAMVGSALSVILFLCGIWFLRRRAIAPLGTISAYMSFLAAGDYSKDVPFTDRGDEIGSIANSVEVFRAAAIERQRLRTETEDQRLRAESDRLELARLTEIEARDLMVVVESLGAGLGRLAECNIRMTLDDPFAEKFEPLRSHFNNAISEFQGALEQVLGKTALLSQSSQEMREAADNLAKRTEQQATALERTSIALVEVSSTVKSSVERTMETRAIVKQARECATASSTVVRQAVSAMQRIEGASREITTIIDVIDQIAFQTNLLALNAGVEAARAGDAGRGFAVVAQEVRELSQRSATAAKQISELITNSTQEIANGVVLVNETGVALTAIETFVASIDEKVDAVATTAREQSIGLQDISAEVKSIDQMTQQNAAMVEETSALSFSLDADSQDLAELAKRFKLNRRATIRDSSGVIVSVKRQAA